MGFVLGWLCNFIFLIAVIGIISWQLMCLADLEYDYTNPYDSAYRINVVVLPEFVTQGALCFIFLLTGQWFLCLLSLPYLFYNLRLYMQRKHLVDVTEIYNLLPWEKKLRLYKLGFLVILLVLSLFWYYDEGSLNLCSFGQSLRNLSRQQMTLILNLSAVDSITAVLFARVIPSFHGLS